jgi:hypothetical protein
MMLRVKKSQVCSIARAFFKVMLEPECLLGATALLSGIFSKKNPSQTGLSKTEQLRLQNVNLTVVEIHFKK